MESDDLLIAGAGRVDMNVYINMSFFFHIKAAIPLVCISAIGWFVFVVGYGLFYSDFVTALTR